MLAPITSQELPTESETPPPPLPQIPPPTSSSYSHMGSISTAHESSQPWYRGHLVSQTPRPHTRIQHHHLPQSPSTSRHRLTSLTSQNFTSSPPPPLSPPLLRQNHPSYLLLRSSIPLSTFRSSRYPLTKLRVWPGPLSFVPPPLLALRRLPLVHHVTPSLPLLS